MNEYFNATYTIPSFIVDTAGNFAAPSSFFLTLDGTITKGAPFGLKMATRCEENRIYAVAMDGTFHFWHHKGFKWNQVAIQGHLLKMVAYGSDGAMWLLDDEGNVRKWNGTDWAVASEYTDPSNPLKTIAFDKDGSLWCVKESGEVDEWSLDENGWVGRPQGVDLNMLAFDADNNMWAINTAHEVLTHQSGGWQNLGHYNGSALRWIDFTFDPRVLPTS